MSEVNFTTMTFEKWLEDKLDFALKAAAESSRVAMNSYGAGFDRGYADALQLVFAALTAEIAHCKAPYQ